jgi:predicted RND superfamily exporter protein
VRLLEEAKISFKEERYDEAEAYLKEAELKLEQASTEYKRVKGLLKLSKNFFQKYWWQIILILIILGSIAKPTIKKVRMSLARKKAVALRSELQTLDRLMKKAQEDCFKNKKITEATYKIRMDRYRKRLAEIKHTLPVVEAIARGEKKSIKKESGQKRRGILEIK